MSARIWAGFGTIAILGSACACTAWKTSERRIFASLAEDELRFGTRLPVLAPRPFPSSVLARKPVPLHHRLGRLMVERLRLSVPVIEGADDAGLKLGAGHVIGTGYAGTPSNFAVAAHRDTLFRPLKDIRKGDVIVFSTPASRFRYHVTGTQIISPTNTGVLASRGVPEMTLITCYPFYFVGHAPKRFIVHARLEPGGEGAPAWQGQ